MAFAGTGETAKEERAGLAGARSRRMLAGILKRRAGGAQLLLLCVFSGLRPRRAQLRVAVLLQAPGAAGKREGKAAGAHSERGKRGATG